MSRKSWIDADTDEPMIDEYARQLEGFVEAFQDGIITDKEIGDQESRLTAAMKAVESDLDDETHAKVTKLLCELTAYDIMQFTHEMQKARVTQFRG